MNTAAAGRSIKPPSGMSAEDYEFLQQYVYRESGIVLERDKRYLMDSRLGPIVRKSGFRTVTDLCNLLRGVGGPGTVGNTESVRRDVVNAMTTNETFFFREYAQYEALRQKVIPALMAKRRHLRTLRFWSAAASTGQEAYSLAMVLLDMGVDMWNVQISATDLNDAVLERARVGRYLPVEVKRGLPTSHLLKYFSRAGEDWQAKDELRRMIQFESLDLRKSFRARGPFDVIFCRNVLIYFDLETKRRVLSELRNTLAPGGYLLLGGAETTINVDERFRRVEVGGATFYQAG